MFIYKKINTGWPRNSVESVVVFLACSANSNTAEKGAEVFESKQT